MRTTLCLVAIGIFLVGTNASFAGDASGLATHVTIRVHTHQEDRPGSNETGTIQLVAESVDGREPAKKQTRTTLRSGNYEVELDTDADNVQITNGKITLMRGQQHILTIELAPGKSNVAGNATTESADSNQEPIYDGKPFREWATILKNERKPEKVAETIPAIAALADGERAREAAALIFAAGSRFGNPSPDDLRDDASPEAKVRAAAMNSLEQIGARGEAVVLFERLSNGSSTDRAYALLAILWNWYSYTDDGDVDFEIARTAIPQILKASHDKAPSVRCEALKVAAEINPKAKGVEDRLLEALADPNPEVVATAADALYDINPKAEGFADALIRFIRLDSPEDDKSDVQMFYQQQAKAFRILEKISPDQAKNLRKMINISESLRHIPKIWERIWYLDLPDQATNLHEKIDASESLRQIPEIWEQIWKLDQAEPYRVHGNVI